MPFGNINVDYAPCKSVGALKAAADYMLGQKKEQIESGVKKTSEGLYTALGCNRENFANGILVTRKLNGKSYSKHKENTILAHKMSISFHPLDNVDHKTAFEIAQDFAEHFIHSKGFEVLFAVHTDTDHVHVHFLIRLPKKSQPQNPKIHKSLTTDIKAHFKRPFRSYLSKRPLGSYDIGSLILSQCIPHTGIVYPQELIRCSSHVDIVQLSFGTLLIKELVHRLVLRFFLKICRHDHE